MTKLTQIGVWLKDHFIIFLVGAGMLFLFFFVPHFQEFFYGLLRATIVLIAISAFIYLVFKDTIRPWLVDGGLIADFKAVEAKHRMAFFAAVFLVITIVVVECLVHP